MQRLRSTWLALMGGALLVTLSVSVALGAPPDPDDGPRGQTVAAFVHELVFGSDETDEDEVVNEDEDESPVNEDEENDELTEEDVAEEAEDEVVEDGDVADSHGECVSEEASDKTDETDSEENHGAVVSFAAQETCWDLEPTDEVTDPEEVVDEVEDEQLEDGASHGACVSEAARAKEESADSAEKNHGAWVSLHARFICWGLELPGEDADEASADADADTQELSTHDARDAARDAARAARTNRGNGSGRGGGRP